MINEALSYSRIAIQLMRAIEDAQEDVGSDDATTKVLELILDSFSQVSSIVEQKFTSPKLDKPAELAEDDAVEH